MSKWPMEIEDLPEEMFEERAPYGDAYQAGPSSFEEGRVGSQTGAPFHPTAPYSREAGFDLFSLPEPQLFRPISIDSLQLEILPEENMVWRSNNATASRPPNQSGSSNWIDLTQPAQALNLRPTLLIPNTHTGLESVSSSRLNWVSGQSTFHPFYGHANDPGSFQAPHISPPLNRTGDPSFPLENHPLGSNRNKRPREEEHIPVPSQVEAGGSSRPPQRLKVSWWDNNYFPHTTIRPLNNTPNVDPTSRPLPIRNANYDPLYGRAGLPVDPHLRMFQAWRDKGN